MPLVPNYAPTDWVDGVTPVNEARMDNIDTNLDLHADAINGLDTRLATEEAMPDIPTVVNGSWIKGVGGAMVWSAIAQADVTGLVTALAAKEATANKGVANGYAPLDSSSKVPAANLPAPLDLRWMGSYAGATAYKEGDVVVDGGIAYMALRATTGETPVPWSTGAGGALTSGENVVGSDVAMATSGTYYDGPSVALTAGTYLLAGHIELFKNSTAVAYTAKLWNSTAVEASGENSHPSGSQACSVALSGLITVPSGTETWKISAQGNSANCIIKAASTSGGSPGGASRLLWIKIA